MNSLLNYGKGVKKGFSDIEDNTFVQEPTKTTLDVLNESNLCRFGYTPIFADETKYHLSALRAIPDDAVVVTVIDTPAVTQAPERNYMLEAILISAAVVLVIKILE